MAQFNSPEDDMQKSFAGLMVCVANGDLIEMEEVLRKFTVLLTSVQEFAHSIVEA